MRRATLLTAVLATFLAACGKDAPKPVSDSEARQFAAAFSAAIEQPNVEKAAAMFDWDALADRSGQGLDAWHSMLLRRSVRQRSPRRFVTALVDAVHRGGDFRLLHVRASKGETTALMRLIMFNRSVNYHEMLLRRGDDGIVRAADVYVYSVAENLSDSFREDYRANEMGRNWFVDMMAGDKSPLQANILEYRAMIAAVDAHDYKRAENAYQTLPPELRRQKGIMMLHLIILGNLTGASDTYLKALDEFRGAYPSAGGADLLAVASLRIRRQYDEALHAIDLVDATVGGDPYQDTMRAAIWLERGDLQRAHDFAARAAQREPTLKRAWWQQVDVAINRSDYPEAARLLTVLRDRLGVKIADLRKAPFYAGFVKSDAYKEWVTASR